MTLCTRVLWSYPNVTSLLHPVTHTPYVDSMLIMSGTLQLVKQIFLMFPETTGKHIFYILFLSVTTIMSENKFLCSCMYCRVCVYACVWARTRARARECVSAKKMLPGGPDTSTSKCMWPPQLSTSSVWVKWPYYLTAYLSSSTRQVLHYLGNWSGTVF